MKIDFCDLCNESVPQQDLDEGRAVLRHGRVICAACEAAMSAGAAPPPRPLAPAPAAGAPVAQVAAPRPAVPARASGRLGLAVATLALLLAIGSAAHSFLGRLADRELSRETARASGAEADERSRRLERRVADLERDREAGVASLTADLAGISERLEESERASEGSRGELGEGLARLEGRLEGLEALRDTTERQGDELSTLTQTTAGLRQDLAALEQHMDAGGARSPSPASAPETGTAGTSRPAAESGTAVPSWEAWVADLTSPNSGTRWQAVQALGESGDPAVVPHLTPRLADADIFVRMAAARKLGDLAVPDAIPALIDALEDEEASVREAALVSLRSLSDQNIAFDPLAKDADRAKRVKAWRDWWEEAAKTLLGQEKTKPRG